MATSFRFSHCLAEALLTRATFSVPPVMVAGIETDAHALLAGRETTLCLLPSLTIIWHAITREEFDKRLDAANARMQQELADTEERLWQLTTLIEQKEAFVQKLERVLADVEHNEAQIAAEQQ